MAELPALPNEAVQKMWFDVKTNIEKNQTVIWRAAVSTLRLAHHYVLVSEDARAFVEECMSPIVCILLDQQSSKIGPEERSCVQESLLFAVSIVAVDLKVQVQAKKECKLLTTLATVFDKSKTFYKGIKATWNVGSVGMPDARIKAIEKFRQLNGFAALAEYLALTTTAAVPSALTKTSSTTAMMDASDENEIEAPVPAPVPASVETTEVVSIPHPSLTLLRLVVVALLETIKSAPTNHRGRALPATIPANFSEQMKLTQEDAIRFGQAVMQYIQSVSDETLKKLSTDQLSDLQLTLRLLFDKFVSMPTSSRRSVTMAFYEYWRNFVWKLLSSGSLPLQLFGWEQLGDMLEACAAHRPPPRYYLVSGAGCDICNGRYEFSGPVTEDGYIVPGKEIMYVYNIPPAVEVEAADESNQAGGGESMEQEEPSPLIGAPRPAKGAKTPERLTIFRCTMRSAHKWWFLSEADEDQPGTDKDVDYYQHKSKESEEGRPPYTGWVTCRNAGVDPPPVLEAHGLMVPEGQEYNTLEHQVARWAIENEIVEQVLGDTTIHREVVARSTVLIKFLAAMNDRYPPEDEHEGIIEDYCLHPDHLLYAWETCLRKADAAVASQVYQLLVSVIPLCHSGVANPLLRAVKNSLEKGDDEEDHLFEVAEFCSALATAILDAKPGDIPELEEDVREDVLQLLWSVLEIPRASSLRSYDTLKRYVTRELRVEPGGQEFRRDLIDLCVEELNANATSSKIVNEEKALRMVELTKFVLDACPRDQAFKAVSGDDGKLPVLLFRELTTYLERKRADSFSFRDNASVANLGSTINETRNMPLHALYERLSILRHVYGLCDPTQSSFAPVLNVDMLKNLWELCDAPDDRQALMVFIAQASRARKLSQNDFGTPSTMNQPVVRPEPLLAAVLPQDVALAVFIELFCSASLDFEYLGDAAYQSFQGLFASTQISLVAGKSGNMDVVIDALWRICLVGSEKVAEIAMKDLFGMYSSMASADAAQADLASGRFHDFRERVFQRLSGVKEQMEAGNHTVSRSMERCLRILNIAIGQQNNFEGHSVCSSTLARLESLPGNCALDDIAKIVPHGMRGRGCYRRVAVLVRRPPSQQAQAEYNTKPSQVRFSLDLHPIETLASVKHKVSLHIQCPTPSVKPIQIVGRAARHNGVETQQNGMSLNVVPEDTSVDELGIVDGCELVFMIIEPRQPSIASTTPSVKSRGARSQDLTDVFFENDGGFSDRLFIMLIDLLKLLPSDEGDKPTELDGVMKAPGSYQLVWDFLLAAPTNRSIAGNVKSAILNSSFKEAGVDTMDVESSRESWSSLLDFQSFDRSVYALLTIDALLRPAREVCSVLNEPQQQHLAEAMTSESAAFRKSFVDAGGFQCVTRFFSDAGAADQSLRSRTRRGNAVVLRIFKSCLFGDSLTADGAQEDALDDIGRTLLDSLSDVQGLLTSLLAMVIDDPGISSSAIADVLRFLSLLFQSPSSLESVRSLSGDIWEDFLVRALTHEEDPSKTSSVSPAMHVRRSAHDLILGTSLLADNALPWLSKAIASMDVGSESCTESFDVLEKLISCDSTSSYRSRPIDEQEVAELISAVCQKLVACPSPKSESEAVELSTGVLCGCLKVLRAAVECSKALVLVPGVTCLLAGTNASRWSSDGNEVDEVLVNLVGVVFDAFLTPVGASAVAVCCDKESRRLGFDVVEAAAKACETDRGYAELILHISDLVTTASPSIKHRWGQFGASNNESGSRAKSSSKYSGLKNAGCTCYMNSVLQQLFMMAEIRNSLCSVPLPTALRTTGDTGLRGYELVGKKLSLHWETGTSYDAIVESFDAATGAHCIRYCPMHVATTNGTGHHIKADPNELARLPPNLPDEFVLSDGRPGKETGVYELVAESTEMETETPDNQEKMSAEDKLSETEDERASRRLLEEVQRTFIHLDEGARGKHFDPKALVEACACLKLEFDVWQQNDASEFTTKLLDRLEISLKKWAPAQFQYLDHMFGIKQIKQKVCRECGLKTNREEKLLNIDCQIRGKTDIREALATLTETEIMEGSNKVFCETCDRNTDTVLRTAISTLPNMLILSLKRFDLDFTTFETVKLNSRCAFGQTLNMKDFTLEGIEAKEREAADAAMDTDDASLGNARKAHDQRSTDGEDYEYRLAGVLVHAGVAQGGHYYSFIRERSSTSDDKWFRFDDEDVTPFDPANIETECFGGRVKKENKWNGQVQMVEQEQFANALMLFYEKVKPSDPPSEAPVDSKEYQGPRLSGYDVFKADVRRSNAAHRWQAFLYDSEFQFFLKRLLSFCALPCPMDVAAEAWRASLLRTLLGYFFDVMPYSADSGFVHDWVKTLEQALLADASSARAFVHGLAKKTSQVSGNWFRTFLLECPDQVTRTGAVRIFGAAIQSCLSFQDERVQLMAWANAWDEQMQSLQTDTNFIAPSSLTEKWATHESVGNWDHCGSSSVGILISHLNVLLDALPRCWRFSLEPLQFIRLLAAMQVDNEFLLRKPLIAALVPMRLVAIVLRDRLSPPSLRDAFSGVSLSVEMASTQMRSESSHGRAGSMSGSQIHLNEHPQRSQIADCGGIIEIIACIASIPGALSALLVVDSGEMVRGRRRYDLTDAASQALATVFTEHCAPGSTGMGRRELESYLLHCGVENVQGLTQRASDMMRKSTIDDTALGPKYLTLNAFLSYYRETVQINELQLRGDLHMLGFRPDLSRRSPAARIVERGGRPLLRNLSESVTFDVAESCGESSVTFGAFADIALRSSWSFYDTAFRYSEVHALYILAAVSYKGDPTELVHRMLRCLSIAQPDWQGNERVGILLQALRAIADVPDQNQTAKVSVIMESSWRPNNVEYGIGLLSVLRYLHDVLRSNPYNNEARWAYTRYIKVVKSLSKSMSIFQWMQSNKAQWALLERDLTEDHGNYQANHIRDDFTARDDFGTYGTHETGARNTDIHMTDMNEDSEGEDDSHFSDSLLTENLAHDDRDSTMYEPNHGPVEIHIQDAGSPEVNGVYRRVKIFQGAYQYSRNGLYGGKAATFSIFACSVSNNSKHWYISVIPDRGEPGTSSDTDFYTADFNHDVPLFPPQLGWNVISVGVRPLPLITFVEPSPIEDDESVNLCDPEGSVSPNDDASSSMA